MNVIDWSFGIMLYLISGIGIHYVSYPKQLRFKIKEYQEHHIGDLIVDILFGVPILIVTVIIHIIFLLCKNSK